MGRINKYNVSKSGKTRIFASSSTSAGYPSASEDNSGTGIGCNLWGNSFDGKKDIDGSMWINGDITIDWDEDDFDDSLYDDEEGSELPSGSLKVKNKVSAKEVAASDKVESKEIYATEKMESKEAYGKTIYLDYPELDNKKTNLLDILKGLEKDIEELKKNPGGSSGGTTPVVLFSGTIYCNNNDGSITFDTWKLLDGVFHESCYGLETGYYLNNPTLWINLKALSGWRVITQSVSAVVRRTVDYDPETLTSSNTEKNRAGYWITGGVMDNGFIHLNAWRTHSGDNVMADTIAYRVQRINLTIFGYAFKNN